MPRVTVGVPVYNGERYLREALASLEAQTYTDFEVVLSDNGSTDGSAAICRDFVRRDRRFSYLRQPTNIGASRNFNATFLRARGEFFKWLAHDDICRAEHIEDCVRELDRCPSATLAYAQTVLIDADGAIIREFRDADDDGSGSTPSLRLAKLLGGDPTRSLLNMCLPVTGLIRANHLRKTGLIRNTPRSDMILLVELAMRGPFVKVENPTFLRRTHQESSVERAGRDANPDEKEKRLAAWYDPRRGSRYPMTRTWLAVGYLRAVLKAPMSEPERLRCLKFLSHWLRANWRIIAGDAKRGVYDRIRSPRHPSADQRG